MKVGEHKSFQSSLTNLLIRSIFIVETRAVLGAYVPLPVVIPISLVHNALVFLVSFATTKEDAFQANDNLHELRNELSG